jgi:hypothetical protein
MIYEIEVEMVSAYKSVVFNIINDLFGLGNNAFYTKLRTVLDSK